MVSATEACHSIWGAGVVQRKFDEYVTAREVLSSEEIDKPIAQVEWDLESNGKTLRNGALLDQQRSSAGQLNGGPSETRRIPLLGMRLPLTHLQNGALVFVITSLGVAAFLGALTSSTLIHFAVSVLLGGIVWRTWFWLLRTWHTTGSSVETHPAQMEPGPVDSSRAPPSGRQPAQLTRPKVDSPAARWSSRRLVQTFLMLAVIVSLLWHIRARPGYWQYGVVIAVAVPMAIWKPRWPESNAVALAHRILASPAHYFTGRIRALSRMQRLWLRAPAATRATIGLCLLLNLLVMLALLDTVKLSFGSWTVHTKIIFIVMSCVDVLLLKTGLSLPRSEPISSPYHFLMPQAAEADTIELAPVALSSPNHFLMPQATEADTIEFAPVAPAVVGATKHPRIQQPHIPPSRGKVPARIAAGSVILAVGWLGYAHPGPLLVLGVLVVTAAMLSTMEVDRHQAITTLLAVGTGVAAVDYMGWRFSVTNWEGWWIAVPLLFAEALGAVHTLGFQFTVWPWPRPEIELNEDPTRHAIFILVPTVNEGVATLRPTLEGCIAARDEYLARYPNGQVTIVVCNDGRTAGYQCWPEIETLAQELGIRCVTRSSGGGAKAGNIENVRQICRITQDSLLVIFDADQVPNPEFLLKTIPPFSDAKVGWVQTGQYYANSNNPVSRWADDQQSMFYNVLCPGKAALNSAFICGTNVVIRAAALDEIGGLPQHSVTEDFAASIALHPRWRSIYLTDVLATGLGPLDVPSYLKQQGRWALGTLGVFGSNWRDILLPKKNGLRLGQRVQYFLACTHYLCGLRDLIYLISPILFIFTGIPAVRTATLSEYLWHFLPYGLLGIGGMWYSTRGVTGLRGIIIGFGSSPALIGSLIAVVLRRKKPFTVTSKEARGQQSLTYLGIYVFFLLLCVVALVWATQIKGRQETSLFISLLWVIYSMLLLASFLWLAVKDIRVRRRAGAAEITSKQTYPSKLLARKNSLKPVLTLGLAALIASPILLDPQLTSLPMFASATAPFVITPQQMDARYTGVSLPVQSLRDAPSLQYDVGIPFSIIGRTQDITDQFDTAWADKLASQRARPWIVLQFGTFGANHEPTLTAGLPAIFNGVDDSALTRWAVEIRNFGKPVYLTVLLQADKNWSVSSGVANGGIPEDVSKAWMHIQSVFRAAGADNVAWVWGPADPLHDQQFAPPPSSINVVLQDFINYPGTRWRDPETVLRSLALRYPGKPLFVEVSLSGAATRKAAWLASLGQAVDDCPQVYALLYHQGGPGLNPTAAQAKSWSLASDPESLAAWQRIVTNWRMTGGSNGNLCRARSGRDTSASDRPPRLVALGARTCPRPASPSFCRYVA